MFSLRFATQKSEISSM